MGVSVIDGFNRVVQGCDKKICITAGLLYTNPLQQWLSTDLAMGPTFPMVINPRPTF